MSALDAQMCNSYKSSCLTICLMAGIFPQIFDCSFECDVICHLKASVNRFLVGLVMYPLIWASVVLQFNRKRLLEGCGSDSQYAYH